MSEQKEEIIIRKLVESDLPKVVVVEGLIHGKDNKQVWPFTFETYWGLIHPNVSFVAEVDGTVVGFIVGKIIKNRNIQMVIKRIHSGNFDFKHERLGWIDMIGVRPDQHKKGIGRMLMEAFCQECKSQNVIVKTAHYKGDENYKRLLTVMEFEKSSPVIYEKS